MTTGPAATVNAPQPVSVIVFPGGFNWPIWSLRPTRSVDHHRELAPVITTLCGHMSRSATNHRLWWSSCAQSPHGRLRFVDRLCRPR